MILPAVVVGVFDSAAQDFVQVPVHSFDLAVALRVVAGGVGDVYAELLLEASEEPAGELLAAVGVDGFRDPVTGENLAVQVRDSFGGGGSLERKSFNPFGERILDGE